MPLPSTAGNQPFSIREAYAYPFAAGLPGAGVAIPYPVSIEGDPQSTEVEHRGGDQVISKIATRDSIDLDFVIATHDSAQIVALVGGTSSDTGTTPNQIRKVIHKATDAPPDVAIRAQTSSRSVDGGGFRLTWPRCQNQGVPDYGLVDAEYKDLTFTLSAIPNPASEMVIVEWFETYTALTGTF